MSRDGYVDLHVHSAASDGVLNPGELIAEARRARLVALSITDHDTIEALADAREAAAAAGLRLVPGVEISTTLDGATVHILGYFFNADTAGFRERLLVFRDDRRERAERMVERLQGLRVEISLDRVLEIAGEAAVGRPHVAEAILEAGYVDSFQEAFNRYIGTHAPAYVSRRVPPPSAAIRLVTDAGGVCSLAHPGTMRRDDLIPSLVSAGLRAIEVWHPRHADAQRRHYLGLARRHRLVATGGSDFHGGGRGDATVGHQPVPAEVLAQLEARAR